MSFESRDLTIDLLPTGKFNVLAQPGFALCGQITSVDEDDEEEEDDLECGQITSNTGDPSGYAPRPGADLALLRRQLQETLAR